MKRVWTGLILAAALVAASSLAFGAGEKAKERPKPTTLQGEIVDMGCYISHGAKGEQHKACATKCIAGGMPMGLLTSKGKLYLLTLNHDDPDSYNQAKEMAAAVVEVTGMVSERNGIAAIDVMGVKSLAPASASEK